MNAVGIACEYVSKKFRIEKGTPDEVWIPYAGQKGLLVFSCNKGILDAEAQRQMWIDNAVGGVFLTTGQERKADVLLLILRRLPWFREIHEEATRPFAYTTTIQGRWKRLKF